MHVLWVFAHPEPSSLNADLRDEGLAVLRAQGHDVVLSDLYAMDWEPLVDHPNSCPADVRAEQRKIDRADAIVLQFPLWWYGPPAILKGWIDRVFVKGYAYGVRDPHDPRRTLRYGEGMLAGKRALVITTTGSPAPPLGPRGINGELDQVLFPLLHGTLFYTGMSVLPPLAIHGADRIDDEGHRDAVEQVRQRVAGIDSAAPIAYRRQNGGDYDSDLVLRDHLAPGETGLAVHVGNHKRPIGGHNAPD